MKLEHIGPVVANGPGASIYLGEDFLVRSKPSIKPEPGDEVGVSFVEEAIHLFDESTGRNVFYAPNRDAAEPTPAAR